MQLVDPMSGEVSKACLFVAALPFSRYSYVEPTLDMKRDTWLRCHVHAVAFFGGCTPIIVFDNLLTGVKKHPKEGEVVLNEACRELAAHYGAAVLPARARHPRDRPSAENEAWCATMYVIGALRGRAFTDMGELRAAVAECVERHNAAPFEKREGSGPESFMKEEADLLRPLAAVPYKVCEWVRGRKVQQNCHVSYRGSFCSASFRAVGSKADLRVTNTAPGSGRDPRGSRRTRSCLHARGTAIPRMRRTCRTGRPGRNGMRTGSADGRTASAPTAGQ